VWSPSACSERAYAFPAGSGAPMPNPEKNAERRRFRRSASNRSPNAVPAAPCRRSPGACLDADASPPKLAVRNAVKSAIRLRRLVEGVEIGRRSSLGTLCTRSCMQPTYPRADFSAVGPRPRFRLVRPSGASDEVAGVGFAARISQLLYCWRHPKQNRDDFASRSTFGLLAR
jgi:hypothetical protein